MSVENYRSAYKGRRRARARRVIGLIAATYVCVAGVVSVSGAAESARGANATAVAATMDSRNCVSCHVFTKTLSHPVGVMPSMRVPDSMPLEDGRVTCLTCHDGTMASGHSDRRAIGLDFLRGSEFAETLCTQCHGASNSQVPHAGAAIKAHLTSSTIKAGVEQLDSESVSCMGCHDGTAASDAGSNHSKRITGGGKLSA